MIDTHIKYLDLNLKSPVIAGSSGLSRDVETVKELEDAGAGAIVLPSLFEEQIDYEIREFDEEAKANAYPEAGEMLSYFQRRHALD